MLCKGQITRQCAEPLWLFVISLVFLAMCSIYECKLHNPRVTEVLLRMVRTTEENGRRKKSFVTDGNTKSHDVTYNCKKHIILPYETVITKTTTIPIT